MKLSRTKGFTLVEIMIVVAIIGIIIAIAVPAFLRARENSRGQACQENLSKIDGAKEQYALEFRASQNSTVSFTNLITPGGASVGQGYLRDTPRCPSSGTYTVSNVGTNPSCSIGTSNAPFIPHVLPQ
jgi:prepilin-type N-terminal cleavage/methylation domain-containing protein